MKLKTKLSKLRHDGHITDTEYAIIINVLNKFSTQPPKTGRWIDDGFYAEGYSEHAYRCSECDENYIGYVGEFKYCPNCGAKMEVEE